MNVPTVEVIPEGHLSLQEHARVISEKQLRIKEAVWDYIESIKLAFEQLGSSVFEHELAKELGMTASTLNRWKSISLSSTVTNNRDQLPPVFSSLYQTTILEKQYKDFYGEKTGIKKLQSLIDRRSINPNTDTKDIKFLVDKIRKERLDQKRREKENYLLEANTSVGYDSTNQYASIHAMVADGVKVRTFLLLPPTDLLTKWSDLGYPTSAMHEEFPVADLRGRSEVTPINCFVLVPNTRLDVGLKLLRSSGFSFRQIFYPSHAHGGFFSEKSALIIVHGQRGMGSSMKNISSSGTSLDDACKIAEQIGTGPFLCLFAQAHNNTWLSLPDPI